MTSALTFFCSCLWLSHPALHTPQLPIEKKLATAADAPLARQVLQESTYSIKGSLVGAPTWLRPFAPTEMNRMEHLSASLSQLDQNLPYAIFPVRNVSGSPIPFECIIEQTGTRLKDTVLLFYADRFDPKYPTQNLVAYNDDIDYPSNKMSAFTSRHGILLDAKRPYFLVITTYQSETLEDTDFSLTTSTPDVLFVRGEPVPTLGEWGLILMLNSLAGAGVISIRRQKKRRAS